MKAINKSLRPLHAMGGLIEFPMGEEVPVSREVAEKLVVNPVFVAWVESGALQLLDDDGDLISFEDSGLGGPPEEPEETEEPEELTSAYINGLLKSDLLSLALEWEVEVDPTFNVTQIKELLIEELVE